jgi:hypothetical protein
MRELMRGFKPVRSCKAAFAAACFVAASAGYSPAFAQASECSKLQGMMQERQTLVARMNAASKAKKLTPQMACGTLGQIVSNGSKVMTFMNANKDWCQIPDAFVDNMKADNARAGQIRNQACRSVSQQAANERKARAQAQQQQAGQQQGGFGGVDAVTGGAWRVPQAPL